jgi:hypothetical protein
VAGPSGQAALAVPAATKASDKWDKWNRWGRHSPGVHDSMLALLALTWIANCADLRS